MSTVIRSVTVNGEKWVSVEDLSRWALEAQMFYEDHDQPAEAAWSRQMVNEFELLRGPA